MTLPPSLKNINTKVKKLIIKTKLFKLYLFLNRHYHWFRFTHNTGSVNQYNNPSSNLLKQNLIKSLAQKNNIDVLVETGTYLGDMIYANLKNFKLIYSIELDKKLFKKAKERFKENKKVNLYQGDSYKLLKRIIPRIKDKTIFWLDAHYSGGLTSKGTKNTPIERELKVILNNWIAGSVITIDDARLFTGENDYPTKRKIKKIISKTGLKLKTVGDIMIIQ